MLPQPRFCLGIWGKGRVDNVIALSPAIMSQLLSLASEALPPHLSPPLEYLKHCPLSETSSCLRTFAQAVPPNSLPGQQLLMVQFKETALETSPLPPQGHEALNQHLWTTELMPISPM